MSLITQPVQFAYCTDNYASTPGTACATAFTAGASGVDGAAVSCIAAIGHDVHFLRIGVTGMQTSAADVSVAADLLIDPAGGTSWTSMIDDLVCGMTATATTGPFLLYEFPVYIKAGSSIGWRAKTQHSADITSGQVLIQAFGEPSNPEAWWCGQGVETLGASGSRGTVVTPGNSGAWGSWTSIGSTSSREYKALQFGINGSDSGASAIAYYWEVGAGSQRIPGSALLHLNMQATELAYRHVPGMIHCDIPSGTQMQLRGMASATGENFYGSVYGVY